MHSPFNQAHGLWVIDIHLVLPQKLTTEIDKERERNREGDKEIER